MLGLAQQDIPGNRPFEPGLEAPALVEHDQAFALIRQAVHQGGGDHHISETDHAGQMVERHLQLFLALDIDAYGRVFEMHV